MILSDDQNIPTKKSTRTFTNSHTVAIVRNSEVEKPSIWCCFKWCFRLPQYEPKLCITGAWWCVNNIIVSEGLCTTETLLSSMFIALHILLLSIFQHYNSRLLNNSFVVFLPCIKEQDTSIILTINFGKQETA